MNESGLSEKWLRIRNKHRAAVLCAITTLPVVTILFFQTMGNLSRDALFGVLFLSLILGGNLVAFLYDKSYSLGPGSYPADGSPGRIIAAFIMLILYMLVQFLPLVL